MGCPGFAPVPQCRSRDDAIGEIWYERHDAAEVNSSLLLKLLFTSQPLSIQVHPDDAYAKSIGQRNGKTEGWYILNAAPDAKIALGLKERLTSQQLREAIDDGSIVDLVVWQAVFAGDSFSFQPAQFTLLARDSSLLKFSSAATRHFAFLITVESANCMWNRLLRWPMPDQPVFGKSGTALVRTHTANLQQAFRLGAHRVSAEFDVAS